MSLKWRIAAALAAVAAVVGALAAVGSYVTTSKELRSSLDESLVTRVSTLSTDRGRDRRGGPDGRDAGGGCPDAGTLQPASTAQLVSTDGTVTACLAGAVQIPTEPSDLTVPVGTNRFRTVVIGNESFRVLTTGWADGQVLQIGRSMREFEQVRSNLRVRLAAITAGGVVLAAALGWLIARRIAQPITRLRSTAETIATTGDLTTPIPPVGGGEVGSLAESFTAMVGALGVSRDQQQQLISDASHEMRTPLTSLRSNVELLEHFDALPTGDRQAVLSAVALDVTELTHLLTELVDLATDPAANDDPPELFVLGDVARSVAQVAQRRSGRTIVVTVGDTGPIEARPHMIERAISNLLENAVKYSPAGSPIEVNVDGGHLEVRDHGPGISEVDAPHVFQRFYRSESARTEPGSGLGLAIVEQVVVRHGGHVLVRNHPGGGAIVGFDLTPLTG